MEAHKHRRNAIINNSPVFFQLLKISSNLFSLRDELLGKLDHVSLKTQKFREHQKSTKNEFTLQNNFTFIPKKAEW